MDTQADLLPRFKQYQQVLNRSRATIEAYLSHLGLFLEALEETDMRRVTRSMIEAYIADLYKYRTKRKTPYRTSTICMKVRSIKRFFEFLERMNLIFIDPCETIKEPPQDKRLPRKILTRKETLKLLDQPDLGTPMGVRDRAILETLDSTGIRVGELCRLTLHDADLTGGLLRINNGKGNKDRVVPLGRHATRFLRQYIARVRPSCIAENPLERHLFVNRFGRAVRKYVVAGMVKRYGRLAGLEKPVSPHLFRHGFATALIRNGADVLAVQKMMGHTQPRTTEAYIRSLGLEVKKVHQKTHPREKDRIDPETITPAIERMMPKDERN